jgi:hypothetical protein
MSKKIPEEVDQMKYFIFYSLKIYNDSIKKRIDFILENST